MRGRPGVAAARGGRGGGGAARAPGGGGFLWEGPGAAVPASEEGCPGSRPGGVGAPRAARGGCSEGGAEAAGGCGCGQPVLLEGAWRLGARDGEVGLCGGVGTGGRGDRGLNGKGAPESGRLPRRERRGGDAEDAACTPAGSLSLLPPSEVIVTRDFDFGPIQFLNFRRDHRIFSCFRHTHLALLG